MITVRAAGESVTIPSPLILPTSPPIPALPRLAWSDEFDQPTIDLTKWNVRNGWAGGNELSICWARNVSVADSCLIIQPRREVSTSGTTTRQFTSGYVDTHGKLSIGKPSYTEVRAKLPLARYRSRGLWPAIWYRLARGALEIDSMEAWGTPSAREDTWGRFQFAVWPDTMSATNGYHGWYVPSGQDLTQWHTYGLGIDPEGTIWFRYDGQPVGFEQWNNGVRTVHAVVTRAMINGLGWDPNVDQLGLRINLQVGQPSYYGVPNDTTDFTQPYLIDFVRSWAV